MPVSIEGLIAKLEIMNSEIKNNLARDAANGMADEMVDIVRTLLSHGGRSAPGMPPGMHSGALRNSIRATPATGGETAIAFVSPHIRYAAIQEFGGTIHPHGRFLHWADARGSMYLKTVTLPPRPYMRPAVEIGEASGAFHQAAVDALHRDVHF